MKIALFLGAGASVPCGMPTTRELKDKIKYGDSDFLRNDLLDPAWFPDIERILSMINQLISFAESRAGKHHAALDDIVVDIAGPHASSHDRAARTRIKQCVTQFNLYVDQSRKSKEIIERLISQHYKWNPSHDETAKKMLGPLLGLAESEEGHATVFTTNYDIVIEAYCGSPNRQTECVDGFKLREAKHIRVWDGEFVPQNQNCHKKVLLYELHGSMNWQAEEASSQGSIAQKPDTSPSDDRARDICIRTSLDTKDKATQRGPYATILGQFARILPSFDACVVIRHSFRDPHISKALVEFARSGKILAIVSPTATTNFKDNALKDSASSKENRWISSGRLHRMDLEYSPGHKFLTVFQTIVAVLDRGFARSVSEICASSMHTRCGLHESVKNLCPGLYNGQRGTVYALNDAISKNNIRSTLDAIRSVIKGNVSNSEASASGPKGQVIQMAIKIDFYSDPCCAEMTLGSDRRRYVAQKAQGRASQGTHTPKFFCRHCPFGGPATTALLTYRNRNHKPKRHCTRPAYRPLRKCLQKQEGVGSPHAQISPVHAYAATHLKEEIRTSADATSRGLSGTATLFHTPSGIPTDAGPRRNGRRLPASERPAAPKMPAAAGMSALQPRRSAAPKPDSGAPHSHSRRFPPSRTCLQ